MKMELKATGASMALFCALVAGPAWGVELITSPAKDTVYNIGDTVTVTISDIGVTGMTVDCSLYKGGDGAVHGNLGASMSPPTSGSFTVVLPSVPRTQFWYVQCYDSTHNITDRVRIVVEDAVGSSSPLKPLRQLLPPAWNSPQSNACWKNNIEDIVLRDGLPALPSLLFQDLVYVSGQSAVGRVYSSLLVDNHASDWCHLYRIDRTGDPDIGALEY